MKYRLSDLRNFVETAQCSTMITAARKLGITPPSLSESIKRLETDLGATLFYRSKLGISLTANGRTLLSVAKTALNEISSVETALENTTAFQSRSVVIGCHPVVGSYLLPQALGELKHRVPDFKVNLKHGSSRQIQNLVQSGQIDIGIVVNPTEVPDLVIKRIAADEIFVWSSSKAKNPTKLICNPDIFQTQYIIRKWKNHPTDYIETENLELAVRLTEKGIGYGILPERAVTLTGATLKKHSSLPSLQDSICLVYRPEFNKSAFEKELTHCLATSL